MRISPDSVVFAPCTAPFIPREYCFNRASLILFETADSDPFAYVWKHAFHSWRFLEPCHYERAEITHFLRYPVRSPDIRDMLVSNLLIAKKNREKFSGNLATKSEVLSLCYNGDQFSPHRETFDAGLRTEFFMSTKTKRSVALLMGLALTIAPTVASAQGGPEGGRDGGGPGGGGHRDGGGPGGGGGGGGFRGAGPHRGMWRSGDRYNGGGVFVDSWHRYPGLYAPPPGYRWIDYGGSFLLAAITTGIISNVIMGNVNGPAVVPPTPYPSYRPTPAPYPAPGY